MASGGDDKTGAFAIDTALVHTLIAEQFPHWQALPISSVTSSGTDNALFRLGDKLLVRLAQRAEAVEPLTKEVAILPRLIGLPLATPQLVGVGKSSPLYPFPWAILEWLDGDEARASTIADSQQAASDLAQFLVALRELPNEGGPLSGAQNHYRGTPLAVRDPLTQQSIAAIGDLSDSAALLSLWHEALSQPPWAGPPTWLHGDLHGGNLLATDERLSAVIDFGLCGLGDPACDAMAAWTYLPAIARTTFRRALDLDDGAWVRGRGWALSTAVIALAYYRETNPAMRASSMATLLAVLEESQG